MPARAAQPAAPSPWIQGRVADLLLYVGTPALILPLVVGASGAIGPAEIGLYVAAFGGFGHHLPGMLRAYGDRELFRRFRVRFIAAPILLVGACIAFQAGAAKALILATYAWGVWHGLMQTHGFLRIYDARLGSTDATTARLDQAACVAWFGAGVLFSPSRVHVIFEALYSCGVPTVSPGALGAVRTAWAVGTVLVSVAFLVNAWRCWRAGRPPSPVKIALLVISAGTFVFVNVGIPHLLLGLALFEIFHDVQYLAIVWHFNRRRAATDAGVGAFTRFLFRRSGVLPGLYVGLVFAYGAVPLLGRFVPTGAVTHAFEGILTASALLHFYYDGFIWKVRERQTRTTLGIQAETPDRPQTRRMHPGLAHGLKWAALAAPVTALALLAVLRGPVPKVEAVRALAATSPTHVPALYDLGTAQAQADEFEAAVATLRLARELGPYDSEIDGKVRVNLAWALADHADERLRAGRSGDALVLLREAHAANALMPTLLTERALLQLAEGDVPGAMLCLRSALAMDPELADAHRHLARLLERQGRVGRALEHARALGRLRPADPEIATLLAALERAVAERS